MHPDAWDPGAEFLGVAAHVSLTLLGRDAAADLEWAIPDLDVQSACFILARYRSLYWDSKSYRRRKSLVFCIEIGFFLRFAPRLLSSEASRFSFLMRREIQSRC